MKVESSKIEFSTDSKDQVVDLTSQVKEKVKEFELKEGICLAFAPHATGVLVLNENESGVKEDYLKGIYEMVPERNDYKHDRIDSNAHSHIKSAFFGQERTIPISGGTLDLGTWQNLFFVETDGPRKRRKVILKAIGE